MDRRSWSQSLRRKVEEGTITPLQYWRGLKKVWVGASEIESEADEFHCESMLSPYLGDSLLRELFGIPFPNPID